ncbi:MAG: guanylate kinase [Opitutales bacterium]
MTRPPHSQGLLFIVSGPAGSGKTTLCQNILKEEPGLNRIVTATTRPPRPGEVDGVDYYFFSRAEFEEKIREGAFYEYAQVHKNFYGTLKEEVRGKMTAGSDILLNIDVQGAASFRDATAEDPLLKGHLVTIFLMPPELDELERRLRTRNTDDEAEIRRRLETARREIEHSAEYDYCLPSSTPLSDCERLHAIYLAEKMRVR